jgi:hypothetical protein
MNDGLLLSSAIELMDSETVIRWNNKHMLPPGYAWNEEGYVITDVPFPFLRACVGLRFGFLIGKLGMREYLRQNLLVLRLLNGNVHKSIVSGVFYSSLRKTGIVPVRELYDEVVKEVFALESSPALDGNFVTWRRTWFSETCEYKRISDVLRNENSTKIDADRELMRIDEKYITAAVAEFTGFSRHRIDNYWSEKQWTKKLRTLYTLEEVERQGIDAPTRAQLAKVSGLSERTVTTTLTEMKSLVMSSRNELCEKNPM